MQGAHSSQIKMWKSVVAGSKNHIAMFSIGVRDAVRSLHRLSMVSVSMQLVPEGRLPAVYVTRHREVTVYGHVRHR